MKTYFVGLGAAFFLAFAAMAAEKHSHDGDTPHDMRGRIMESFGANLGALGKMAKGEADFDKTDVEARLLDVNANAIKLRDDFDALWPEGSITENSEASPAIWEKPDAFKAAIDQFIADTTLDAYPDDAAALGAALGAIGKNCKSCHEGFRTK